MIVFDDIKLQLQSFLLKNMFVATFMAWPCSRIFMPSHQCCNFSVSQFHNICNGVTEKLDCIFYNQKKYCDQIIYPNNSFYVQTETHNTVATIIPFIVLIIMSFQL